jgi:hypothetical protein
MARLSESISADADREISEEVRSDRFRWAGGSPGSEGAAERRAMATIATRFIQLDSSRG